MWVNLNYFKQIVQMQIVKYLVSLFFYFSWKLNVQKNHVEIINIFSLKLEYKFGCCPEKFQQTVIGKILLCWTMQGISEIVDAENSIAPEFMFCELIYVNNWPFNDKSVPIIYSRISRIRYFIPFRTQN